MLRLNQPSYGSRTFELHLTRERIAGTLSLTLGHYVPSFKSADNAPSSGALA